MGNPVKSNACSLPPRLGHVILGCLAAALLAATLGGCARDNNRSQTPKGLGSWFKPEEPKQSKTMADFMKQPRPDF